MVGCGQEQPAAKRFAARIRRNIVFERDKKLVIFFIGVYVETDTVYEELADALGKLPNGFTRTPSNVEVRMLRKILSPEDASLASKLSEKLETAQEVAERTGLPLEETRDHLLKMAEDSLLWLDHSEFSIDYDKDHLLNAENPRFRLPPFLVGLLEMNAEEIDHEFIHLFEAYMADGGAAGIMKPGPALMRAIPSQGSVKKEWILPYDEVKFVLSQAKTFFVYDCVCRTVKEEIGRECDFPLNNCLYFSSHDHIPGQYSKEGQISKEKVFEILDKSEELGLVHTISNVIQGAGYLCNCCGCCCTLLRGINEWGIDESIAAANYYATIDQGECAQCGTCIERCQVNAITEDEEDVPFVNKMKCIGCGICVTGCTAKAVCLHKKPDDEIIQPPEDFVAWEKARHSQR